MTSTTSSSTRYATSADGTRIAYDVRGSGPAPVLVDGALCHREMGPSRDLAEALAGSFTVHSYDRRGRGESGPGSWPYDIGAEVDDLRAVIGSAGARAHVLGVSSGAALALEAARRGVPVDRLVVYEAPFIVDGTRPPNDPRLPEQLQQLVQDGRRGEAVRTFLRTVGVPAPFIWLMRLMPSWPKLCAVAHTLPYDLSIVVEHEQGTPLPSGHYDQVGAETLVLAGGKSPVAMRNAQAAIAEAVPGARLEVLPGQTHMVRAAAVAPVVADFLRG
jgi:pimeloyl-ACP methyl ester carboxylesterase